MKNLKNMKTWVACLVMLGCLMGGQKAMAMTVDTTEDNTTTDGKCSLREAVMAANSQTTKDTCTATSGANLITLPDNITLSLNSKKLGPLFIQSDITITTQNKYGVINANGGQVFNVITPNINFNLTNIKIINANFHTLGSVILSTSTMHHISLKNVWFDHNITSAISLENGQIDISQSTFSNNTYGNILTGNDETITIANSTFYNNITYSPASPFPTGNGGAISTKRSSLKIYSSTFNKNGAGTGGALATESTSIYLVNNLFTGNGDIYSNANWDSSTSAPDTFHDINNNIFSVADPSGKCNNCKIDASVAVDSFDTTTGLIPLPEGSSAIDAGANCVDSTGTALAYDQRGEGYPRVSGDSCDVGAYEFQQIICGDGKKEGTEECDDGNLINGDSCSSTCKKETTAAACGDGKVDSGEECDNGSANNDSTADACRTTCKFASCGDNAKDTGEECDQVSATCDQTTCKLVVVSTTCGDGVVDTSNGEECDDGANNSDTKADACRTTCKFASCGDGVVDPNTKGEQCDEGTVLNGSSGSSCSAQCLINEPTAICGDGKVNGDEECDGTSDCNSDCTYKNSPNPKPGPDPTAVCGNGTVEGDEECDDGNVANNDTCSDVCVKITVAPKPEPDTSAGTESNSCGAGGILGFLPLFFGAGALKLFPFFRGL